MKLYLVPGRGWQQSSVSRPMFQSHTGSHLYLSENLWLPLCLWPIAVLSLKFSLFYTPWLSFQQWVSPDLHFQEPDTNLILLVAQIGNITNMQCHWWYQSTDGSLDAAALNKNVTLAQSIHSSTNGIWNQKEFISMQEQEAFSFIQATLKLHYCDF